MGDYGDPADYVDGLLFLISNYRRRVIIRYLAAEGHAYLKTIANVIASHECCDSDASTVYVNLYQTHAPKLDTYDVVVYDSSAKHLSQGTQFEVCAELLACADDLA